MFAPVQLWLEQRPSNRSDLDSSVTGENGRVDYMGMNLLTLFLYCSMLLFWGWVLNDTPCIIESSWSNGMEHVLPYQSSRTAQNYGQCLSGTELLVVVPRGATYPAGRVHAVSPRTGAISTSLDYVSSEQQERQTGQLNSVTIILKSCSKNFPSLILFSEMWVC